MFGLRRAEQQASIYGLSHCGAVREENEDAMDWWTSPSGEIRFGLIADGMGGHAGGAFASKLAIQEVRKYIDQHIDEVRVQREPDSIESLMVAAVAQANSLILQARETMPEFSSMGTTVVFVAVWAESLAVLNIGDSRCYVLESKPEQNGFIQITHDDSVVQAMLDEGVITEADVPNIPYRNKLTKALGIKPVLEYSVEKRVFQNSDALLLCSDGFYHSVALDEVTQIVRSNGVSQATVEQLIALSLDNHTDDNTSVLLISGNAA